MGPSRAMEVAVAMAGANCSPASTNKVLCCSAAALVFMGFKKDSLWFRMAFLLFIPILRTPFKCIFGEELFVYGWMVT